MPCQLMKDIGENGSAYLSIFSFTVDFDSALFQLFDSLL